MDATVVGVLGGGQLGRMFAEAASRLNVTVRFLDVGDNTPAKQITNVPASVGGAQHVDGQVVGQHDDAGGGEGFPDGAQIGFVLDGLTADHQLGSRIGFSCGQGEINGVILGTDFKTSTGQ